MINDAGMAVIVPSFAMLACADLRLALSKPGASTGRRTGIASRLVARAGRMESIWRIDKQGNEYDWIVLISSSIVLILVFLARIALGAHWPGDLLISYLGFICGSGSLWSFSIFIIPLCKYLETADKSSIMGTSKN